MSGLPLKIKGFNWHGDIVVKTTREKKDIRKEAYFQGLSGFGIFSGGSNFLTFK